MSDDTVGSGEEALPAYAPVLGSKDGVAAPPDPTLLAKAEADRDEAVALLVRCPAALVLSGEDSALYREWWVDLFTFLKRLNDGEVPWPGVEVQERE